MNMIERLNETSLPWFSVLVGASFSIVSFLVADRWCGFHMSCSPSVVLDLIVPGTFALIGGVFLVKAARDLFSLLMTSPPISSEFSSPAVKPPLRSMLDVRKGRLTRRCTCRLVACHLTPVG